MKTGTPLLVVCVMTAGFLSSGCSYFFVQPVPSKPNVPNNCTSAPGAPLVDVAAASIAGIATVGSSASFIRSSGAGFDSSPSLVAAVTGLGAFSVFLASGIYGFSKTAECRSLFDSIPESDPVTIQKCNLLRRGELKLTSEDYKKITRECADLRMRCQSWRQGSLRLSSSEEAQLENVCAEDSAENEGRGSAVEVGSFERMIAVEESRGVLIQSDFREGQYWSSVNLSIDKREYVLGASMCSRVSDDSPCLGRMARSKE